MGVYFSTQEGKQGMLDVVMLLRSEGYMPFKVQDGNVLFNDGKGNQGLFSVAQWAVENHFKVSKIDGFNTPMTALDIPPLNLTSLDQSVWYMDGAKMDALQEMYPQAMKLDDGRVVVLDSDGLWKCMWSDTWQAQDPYPSYEDRVGTGEAIDTRTGMKSAGIAFLFGLAGVDPKLDKEGDIKPDSVAKMLHAINKNAPLETQMALAKLIEQTTGVDQWKFTAALNHPEDIGYWLHCISTKTTFDFRMIQADHAEIIVAALHKLSIKEFTDSMEALVKLPETKSAVINMRECAADFLAMLHNMDVIRDMSKVTGLDDWKADAEVTIDKTKLPPMPSFVPRMVKLLQFVMPMAKDKALMLTKGVRGIRAVTMVMVMIDACIYSLSDVPDSTAKQKMTMVLKNFQVKLESKLAMTYQPINDDKGMKVNPFMQAKGIYTEKREVVYKLVQIPKEMWSKSIIDKLRLEPNLEAFFDVIPEFMAKLLQSFVAMDTAYDMQPWIDSNYQERILDSFAQYQDAYGPPPPEFGALANNSPRAALNIIDTLATAAGMIGALPDSQRREILRRPIMFANMMKMIQTASVGREIGAVEILNRMGIQDPYASPSSEQIWRDPNDVQAENDAMEQQISQFIQGQMAQQQQSQLDQQAADAQNQGTEPPADDGAQQEAAPMPPAQQPGAGKVKGNKAAPASAAPNGGGATQALMSAMGG